MPLYPFTPTGVADFLDEIYTLPNIDLLEQATEVEADFSTYMLDHFALDTEQQSFLASMPSEATEYLGERCAFCFVHRLPIVLIKPEPPVTGYSKIVETEDKTKTQSASGVFEVSGSFEISIVYIPE